MSLWQLFRFAERRDFLFMGLGTFCSIAVGAALPFFSLLWGNMTDAFKEPDSMVRMALDVFVQYVLFGVGAIFGGWGMQYFWLVAGEGQANRCRQHYLSSLMRQEVGWHEAQQSAQVVSRFLSDTLAFQLAIGDKMALVIYLVSMFVSGLVISFSRGWKMTLVVLACVPLLVFSWWLMEFYTKRRMEFE